MYTVVMTSKWTRELPETVRTFTKKADAYKFCRQLNAAEVGHPVWANWERRFSVVKK